MNENLLRNDCFVMKEKEVSEDKIKTIEMYSEVIFGETLSKLQEQAGNLDDTEMLIVKIASCGGSVNEGLNIMIWLDELSAKGISIVTVVTANSYSIASLIMLAANYRIISSHGKVMVHNPMVAELKYANADELEKNVASLRMLEKIMYELYMNFTGLNMEAIKELMDNETYLTPQKAFEYGFVDEVVDIEKVPYVEASNNNKNKELDMSNILNMIHKSIGKINGAEFINQLYYDLDGGKVNIYQSDASVYKKGDKTDIENGILTIADGSTLTIVNYVIEEITKDVEAADNKSKEAEETKADKEAEVETSKEAEVVAKEVEKETEKEVEKEVEVVAKETEKEKEEVSSEVVAKEAEKEVEKEVEAVAKEVEASEDAVAGEFNTGKEPAAVAEVEKEDPMAEIKGMLVAMSDRLSKLEDSSVEAKAERKSTDEVLQLTAEAISNIAEKTGSSWSPEAKVVEKEDPSEGASIFQRIRMAQAQAK